MWLKPKGFLLRQVTGRKRIPENYFWSELRCGSWAYSWSFAADVEGKSGCWSWNPGSGMECIPAVTKRRRLQYKQKRLDRRLYGSVNFHGHIKPETVRIMPCTAIQSMMNLFPQQEEKLTRLNAFKCTMMRKRILMDDAAIAPLYFYTDPIVISPNLKGVLHSQLGS